MEVSWMAYLMASFAIHQLQPRRVTKMALWRFSHLPHCIRENMITIDAVRQATAEASNCKNLLRMNWAKDSRNWGRLTSTSSTIASQISQVPDSERDLKVEEMRKDLVHSLLGKIRHIRQASKLFHSSSPNDPSLNWNELSFLLSAWFARPKHHQPWTTWEEGQWIWTEGWISETF